MGPRMGVNAKIQTRISNPVAKLEYVECIKYVELVECEESVRNSMSNQSRMFFSKFTGYSSRL